MQIRDAVEKGILKVGQTVKCNGDNFAITTYWYTGRIIEIRDARFRIRRTEGWNWSVENDCNGEIEIIQEVKLEIGKFYCNQLTNIVFQLTEEELNLINEIPSRYFLTEVEGMVSKSTVSMLYTDQLVEINRKIIIQLTKKQAMDFLEKKSFKLGTQTYNTGSIMPIKEDKQLQQLLKNATKIYDDTNGTLVYLFPPTKIKLNCILEDRTRKEYKIWFPSFIIASRCGQVYLMFCRDASSTTKIFTERLFWPPLPNIFSDGKMCLAIYSEENKWIKVILYKFLTTLWDVNELRPLNKPASFPYCSSIDDLLTHWSKLSKEDVEKLDWKSLEGLSTIDQFMRMGEY